MTDGGALAAAVAAGSAAAIACQVALAPARPSRALAWLRRRGLAEPEPAGLEPRSAPGSGRRWLGWVRRAAPESAGGNRRLASALIAAGGGALVLGLAAVALGGALDRAAALALGGMAAGLALRLAWLRSAARRRREQLGAELVPMLDLLTLEVSGGAGLVAALGSISARTQGALASELRRAVVGAQLAGSTPLDVRLSVLAEAVSLPALASLAAIVGTSREFGTASLPGLRALSRELRQAQRRRLIAHGRRALNRVLLPAAVGVLLPFIAVLLYPALVILTGAWR